MAKHHPDLIMCRKQPGNDKVVNIQESQLVDCAKNVTENVLFATPMCDLISQLNYAMSATMVVIKEDVLYAEVRVYLTLIIAKNVFNKKKMYLNKLNLERRMS